MQVRLVDGPYDQDLFTTEDDATMLRLSCRVGDSDGSFRWNIYRRTDKQDADGLPIFLLTCRTDEDDEDGPSLQELESRGR